MNDIMKYIFILFSLLLTNEIRAQEVSGDTFEPQLRGAIVMANSHIPQAREGGKTVAVIPTWGFDFDYLFHKRWSVGLQSDIKLQSFEIEEKDQVVLARNFPVSLALMAHYRTMKAWSFFLGPGIEFEQSENLFIAKIGVEYSFEITEKFGIGLGLMYENRDEVYDGFTFGVSFGTLLWK